jgi:hypothetical protein
MKKINYGNLMVVMLFATLHILVSCSTSQKTALSCPRIPDARFNYKASHEAGKRSNYNLVSYKKPVQRKHSSVKNAALAHNAIPGTANYIKEMKLTGNQREENYADGIDIDRNEYMNGLTASLDNSQLVINHHELSSFSSSAKSKTSKLRYDPLVIQDLCDTIVSAMGDVIIGKVTEVSESEIKYKRCGISNSPTYSIRKSNISVIKYANGTRDFFTGSGPVDYRYSTEERKVEGLGLAGFIASIAGLFVLGIPFGLLAVIFGTISFGRIKRSPGRYKGKGYAITSIILGIVDIIGVIILLAYSV